MKDPGGAKRTLADSILLWFTACIVVSLGVAFFWTTDDLHFEGRWRLYLLLNVGFCAFVIWRFRRWLSHWRTGLVLTAWLTLHLAAYGFLTTINLNQFFCVFLFPAEVAILKAIGEMAGAKQRESQLRNLRGGQN